MNTASAQGSPRNGRQLNWGMITAVIAVIGFGYTNARDPYRLTKLEEHTKDLELRLRASEVTLAKTADRLDIIAGSVLRIEEIMRVYKYAPDKP